MAESGSLAPARLLQLGEVTVRFDGNGGSWQSAMRHAGLALPLSGHAPAFLFAAKARPTQNKGLVRSS